MNKMDKNILVVKRKLLFQDDHFQGFSPKDKVNFESRILTNYEFKKRGDMETDPKHKQPIPYVILVNDENKVFLFQRSKKQEDYSEKRLYGKWSCGVGGHIDEEDEGENPIHTSMLRELDEEVEAEIVGKPEVLGYINHDDSEVGQVHIGVLYLVKANSVKPRGSEISNGAFRTIEEFEEIINSDDFEVEEWAQTSFHTLKEHLL